MNSNQITLQRLAVSLFLSVSVSAVTAAAPLKPGVERWPIKTSVAPGADLAHPKQIAFPDLVSLEDPPGVTHNDSRYQSNLIPPFENSENLKEGDIVSTTGWIHLVAGEADGDFHIQVSDSKSSGNRCLIVEVPKDDPAFESDEKLRARCSKVRKFITEKVLLGATPSESGTVIKEPVFVKVTGQLFFDDAHVGDKPRGKKGMKAATLWELHPVTDIKLAHPPTN